MNAAVMRTMEKMRRGTTFEKKVMALVRGAEEREGTCERPSFGATGCCLRLEQGGDENGSQIEEL